MGRVEVQEFMQTRGLGEFDDEGCYSEAGGVGFFGKCGVWSSRLVDHRGAGGVKERALAHEVLHCLVVPGRRWHLCSVADVRVWPSKSSLS